MPGSGKTRVGEQIALRTGREHIDLDRALEERLGMPCADYIVERGEAAFREQTAALSDISKRSGLVLSTGGGVVTRDENYPLLHQNSQIVMLNRKLDELAHKGRPITARDGINKLAEQRMPRYRAWSDYIIDSRDCAANTTVPSSTPFFTRSLTKTTTKETAPLWWFSNRKGSNHESAHRHRTAPTSTCSAFASRASMAATTTTASCKYLPGSGRRTGLRRSRGLPV